MALLNNTLGCGATAAASGNPICKIKTIELNFHDLYKMVQFEHGVFVDLKEVWSNKPNSQLKRVLRDMNQSYIGYANSQFRQNLYKPALEGLWAMIQKSPKKEILIELLWKEVNQVIGGDCMSHLASLCNVIKEEQ